jgi:ABC-type transport system involved in multi-copper enzyme maturation permease subunit
MLFFLGFFLTLIVGLLIFDRSDSLSLNWFLWGTFLQLISGLFYVSLVLFTSSIFRGSVASVLLTLAVLIGIPIIGSAVITIELLMRGLISTPPSQWETVSYVARMLLWWPAALSDAQAFLSVTVSEIRTGTINYFGQSFELDAHFRYKPLISTLVVSPFFALFAWRRYSRREL